jgi:predicted DNA-binding transcriptional regulator AlpA
MRKNSGKVWEAQLPGFLGMSKVQVDRLIKMGWFPQPNVTLKVFKSWQISKVHDWQEEK